MSSSPSKQEAQHEEDLRNQLLEAMQSLKRREPLDPTYKRYLMSGTLTNRRPVLPKDKTYRRIGSDLRATVETFAEQTQGRDPFDRIEQRQPLQEDQMRAALTLREAKKIEQKALLEATLSALPKRGGMDALTRRRHLEGIFLGLQSPEHQAAAARASAAGGGARTPTPSSAAQQTEQARQQAELEAQRAQAKAREEARLRREEEDRQRRQQENIRQRKQQQQQQRDDTPQGAHHKYIHPIFKMLWDMEFPLLGGTNPFRVVIDRENCASCGAPDYFDVIQRPMNLTYIQRKVEHHEYATLHQFVQDVELMISNALLYNSDPRNPYHIAAKELGKKFRKACKRVLAHAKVQAPARK